MRCFIKKARNKPMNLSQRLRTLKFRCLYLGDASLPSFFITEHKTCLEMYVSSSLETSVNFKSKLLLYFCFGDGITLENIVGEPENRRLGLENLPGEPGTLSLEMRGVVAVPELAIFLSGFISGPRFVSSGSGFNGSSSTAGFCFISLSLALSAARRAFSLLRFISFHGSMLTWKSFLYPKIYQFLNWPY